MNCRDQSTTISKLEGNNKVSINKKEESQSNIDPLTFQQIENCIQKQVKIS